MTDLTEAEFQKHVVRVAEMLGYKVNHHRRSIGGRKQGWVTATTLKGMLDLLLIRPPRVIYAELKSADGKLTPEQSELIGLLRQCPGVEVYVWRPSDLQAIADLLQRPGPPPCGEWHPVNEAGSCPCGWYQQWRRTRGRGVDTEWANP